jgi:hypothetical protein
VTSDILSISSLKIIARYNGRTGRDFAAVGPKRPEKKKKKGRKMWVHLVMCDKQVTADYSRRSEDRRSEVLFILECMWILEELYETTE